MSDVRRTEVERTNDEKFSGSMTTIATYHVRMVNGRATASGEKSSEALASWCATMSQFWLFPRTRGPGAVDGIHSVSSPPVDSLAQTEPTERKNGQSSVYSTEVCRIS